MRSPATIGLTLLGLGDGAGLVVEAWGGQPLARVAKEQATVAVAQLAALVTAERKPGESEAACLARIGKSQLAQAFIRES